MKNKLYRLLYRLLSMYNVFKHNNGKISPMLNLSGFFSIRKQMYPNFLKQKKDYFSDFHRYYSYIINHKNQYIFTKLNAYYIFSKLVRYTNVYGVIVNKEFIPIYVNQNFEEILSKKSFVLKPIFGGGGKGVKVCNNLGNGIYTLNSQEITIEKLYEEIFSLENYIIEDFVQQHDLLKNIYSKSTNTLRLVTMREPNTNEIYIPWGVLRIGTKESAPVDNWSSGGISAEINLENGTLSEARMFNYNNRKLMSYKYHPETNFSIKGLKLPNLNIIKKDLTKAHKLLPHINFIAWDVVITNDSYTVIEVNNTTGVGLIQVHKPILKDKRVRSFYKHHGVIR